MSHVFGYRLFRLVTIPPILAALILTATPSAAPIAFAALRSVNYTALGDSLAFGLYALPGHGYVPRYANGLQKGTGLPVHLIPAGVPGWKSADLADALKNNPIFRFLVFYSEVVTWDIGGNDLNAARSSYKAKTCGGIDNQQCLRTAVATFQSNWSEIINSIMQLRHGRPTILRTLDIYNPYVDEDRATGDFEVLNGYLTQVNDIIHSTQAIAPCARVDEAFNLSNGSVVDPAAKGLLAFDGFHPNGSGHALIAAKLSELGYASTIP